MVQFDMAEISPVGKKKGRGCQILFSLFLFFFSNFIYLHTMHNRIPRRSNRIDSYAH